MKKILSFILILTLSLTVLAACGGKEDEETAYTLGIGVVMKVDEASATAESTVAAVVTDGDGKIEGENNAPAEKDPIDAIENMTSRSGGWITVAACIAAIIALVLIIVALIPKKRM